MTIVVALIVGTTNNRPGGLRAARVSHDLSTPLPARARGRHTQLRSGDRVMTAAVPRIALLGFAIECNRFSPVATREDFASDVDIAGEEIIKDARAPASI